MESTVSAERTLDASSLFTYLRDQARGPMSPPALARELELSEESAARLQALLDKLVTDGRVVETRGRYGCPDRMNLVVGALSAHPDGFAFVVSDTPDGDDLFIPGHRRGGAQHGDRVVARREHRRRSGKVEGRVIRILERARTTLVGTVRQAGPLVYVQPMDARLGRQVLVPAEALAGATPGKIVQIEIREYPNEERSAVGEVIEVLGDAGDPSVDVDVIIREYELPHAFPEEVSAAAATVPTEVSEADIEGRTDFRDLPIVTIDGESAQDFDDAVHVQLLPNGCYRLHVHIADVAHYVRPGSVIDDEARRRATSVYFPGHVIPMLPESLSNEICSLKPQVDRLVQSVLIDIDRDGRTMQYEFHDGVIRSAARLTYRQVAAVLGGDDATRSQFEAYVGDLERMRDVAEMLMEGRRERGSIDFDLPEPEIVINLRGETEDIVQAERNIAHRIIEEFMIRANEVVASHLTWEGVEALYRVHAGPDPARVEALREFISGLGHTLGGGDSPRPRHFAELLSLIEGRPEERVVSTLVLRTMKQARYEVDNDGHFGLASARYTHFTSPIRRYPDLIVHRALRHEQLSASEDGAEVSADAVVGDINLERVASECSVRERRAEEAEREYCAWKKVQFMADKLGEQFEGHVTGVQAFGLFVQLEPFFVEGMIPVSTLDDDYYRYEEAKHSLRGENSGRTFTLGDRVKVSIARADLVRRRIDLALEEGPLAKPEPVAAPKRRRRRRRGGQGRRKRAASSEQPVAASEAGADERARKPAEAAAAGSDRKEAERKEEGGTRRRRGRRGGRRRRGARSEQRGSSAPKPERESKGDGERKPRSGSADKRAKDAKKGDGERGRGKRPRRRTSRPRRPVEEGPRPAPARVESSSKPKTQRGGDRKDDSERSEPAINPYLTDVDF